jgi:hypothetical protein
MATSGANPSGVKTGASPGATDANVPAPQTNGPNRGDVATSRTRSVTMRAETEEMRDAEHRDPVALLEQWLRGIKISHVGHTRAATVFARRARYFGVGATLVTAVVGTTLFSSLTTAPDPRLVTFAAIGSVVAVILTALQTFLNYGELVTGHRAAAGAYGDLRRRAEQLLVFGEAKELRDPMAEIATTWTKLEQDSPDLPQGIYSYATKWVATREGHNRLGPG